MNLKDIEGYIKLAKKHKLKHFTVDNISFELRDPIKRNVSRGVTQKEINVIGGMPSDSDMLYYSADSPIQIPKS